MVRLLLDRAVRLRGATSRPDAPGRPTGLRPCADELLARLRDLDALVQAGGRVPRAELDEIATAIRGLQDRIEAAGEGERDLGVLAELAAARRSVCDALLLTFSLLGALQ